jgi:hypothetical protein
MRHCSIVGLPGSGKTVFAVKVYKRCERAVFINLGHEDLGQSNPLYWQGETPATSAQEALQIVLGGGRCVWLVPEISEVRPFIADLIKYQREQETKFPISVFVDEAHLLIPTGSINLAKTIKDEEEPDPWTLLATNGRRWNLQAVWITQRPQLLDPTCYKTAVNKFFFRLDPADINYFRRMGITIEDIKEEFGFDLRVS